VDCKSSWPCPAGSECKKNGVNASWGKCSFNKIQVDAWPAPLPGVSNDGMKPKVIIAQATDYPPWTKVGDDLEISGFGPDCAKGLEEVCDIDIVLVQTAWNDCWASSGSIGSGLLNGHYHGCSAYTHTKGVRNRFLEFSAPIVSNNKAAGILTRLNDGVPVVDGMSSLSGVKVGDVSGWAPTADVLAISMNQCTGETFSGFTLVTNGATEKQNDVALTQLLDGDVDALWIYADQAATYKSACDNDANQEWDCELWSKFGSDFAYIQTGMYDYMVAGTTLAISKKGSGLAQTLDPCIEAFLKTESYKNLCDKYGVADDCIANDFFELTSEELEDYRKPTAELTTSCIDGYCPCPN